MKLFTKYNRINLLTTVGIFLLASLAFSFLLRYVVTNQVDEDLRIEKNEILTYISKNNQLPPTIDVHDQYTTYRKTERGVHHKNGFYTTKRKGGKEDDELVRTIMFPVRAGNETYVVTVSKSLEGTDDLIQSISIITVSTIVLILLTTLLINRILLRRLWQPFYDTLATIQNFRLTGKNNISFRDSKIDEFQLLNTTLHGVINKAQQDYLVLKEFTENASHEMQTPLAILRSKLDLLIQNEDLTEAQSRTLQGSYEAIRGMKKLNESLLLLAKIDNQQFSDTTVMPLHSILEDKKTQFLEQWQNGGFEVKIHTVEAYITGNQYLVDILLNNLLSNATKHNISGGSIEIHLTQNTIAIINTGVPNALEKNSIFNRFYKGNTGAGKHGLGLSIVKQICEVSGYTCNYQFESPNLHSFLILW